MPPKTSRPGWKTGEQLEFLISRWRTFKRAQDIKGLDKFWPKVFEDWYIRWPIPHSPSLAQSHGSIEEGRLVLQKEKNVKIKQWFNNRGRSDSVKGSRGDLKLDVNEKRKLAAVQAYCSYAWSSTLRPIVLTRWQQQKTSATFADEDDPPEDAEGAPEEACIPLSFKLKIAKELYESLSSDEKQDIDRRREDDRRKMYRRIPDISEADERHKRLQVHSRNQPFVPKALNRVLLNLEHQAGCVAQLMIASVNPEDGTTSIKKFCQGSTQHGLGFETFYGEEWEEKVENPFRLWALRVFGEKDSDRRDMFLLPEDTASPSEPSSSGSQTEPEPSSQNTASIEATQSQKSASRPSRPRKSAPRPLTSEEPTPHSLPTPTSTPQATVTSSLPQDTSAPVPDLPMLDASNDSPPDTSNFDGDAALFATAIGVHQLLSQVATVPQVIQEPRVVTSESARDIGLPQLVVNPSQLIIEPPQTDIEPPQTVVEPPQTVVQPPQTIVQPSQTIVQPSQTVVQPPQTVVQPPQTVVQPPQTVIEHSQSAAESSASVSEHPKVSTEVVSMNTQPDSAVPPIPSQLLTKAANATSSSRMPGVPYRARNATAMPSGVRSRRGSIDGAPEMVVDDEETTVDLREYINMESDDDTHVSSSQKTSDECRDLSLPPPGPQQQPTEVGTAEGNTSQSELASSRTHPQLDVDEDDFPAWMTKKGQWRYITSTAGGTAWENLLKIYINQERRLEFTEMGATLTNEGRPLKIKEYFQYAHQPSRGDTLVVPEFGAEVAKWWERIQPEWRRSEQDLPQNLNQWAYILSGGSKGAFLVILCLAWWDRAHERHVEKEKEARRVEAEAAGVTANFSDLPDHDAKWLKVVNDVAFVMQRARDCAIPARGVPSPSRRGKRKRQEDSVSSEQAPATKRSSRKIKA